jgi:hypothetical protein
MGLVAEWPIPAQPRQPQSVEFYGSALEEAAYGDSADALKRLKPNPEIDANPTGLRPCGWCV